MTACYTITMAALGIGLSVCTTCVAADPEHSSTLSLRGNGEDRSMGSAVGVYHWGGQHAQGVASGLRAITNMGGSIARMYISPRMAIDYNTGTSCIPEFRLASVLDDLELRAAMGDPKLKVIMLTAYDGASFGDCKTHSYLSPSFYSPANAASVVEEYRELTLRLYELFQGSDKTFILSNWEGDNALYCGQAFAYVTSSEFRSTCDKTYAAAYSQNRDVNDSVEGMKLWLRARYSGVSLGRQAAGTQDLRSMQVLVAPEISAVHMLHELGLPSMLYDVLPYVPYDFVSYSAYESLGTWNPVLAIKKDLDAIRLVTGSTNIILGEIGCARSTCPHDLIEFTFAVTSAALEWGVRYVIHWNLYDQNASDNFGLFDTDGEITDLGRYYRRLYSGASPDVISGRTMHSDLATHR